MSRFLSLPGCMDDIDPATISLQSLDLMAANRCQSQKNSRRILEIEGISNDEDVRIHEARRIAQVP